MCDPPRSRLAPVEGTLAGEGCIICDILGPIVRPVLHPESEPPPSAPDAAAR